MSLPEYITPLYPPKKAVGKPLPALISIGKRYLLENLPGLADRNIHGLVAGYRFDARHAEIVPLQASDNGGVAVYFWDTHCDLAAFATNVKTAADAPAQPLSSYRLCNNRLELRQTVMNGPEIATNEHGTLLTLSPCFEATFSTDAYAARLGMLHLVQAKRLAVLASGRQITLLDSGDEPVLYLPEPDDEQALAWESSDQALEESRTYSLSADISQAIPADIHGDPVAELTVLERYSSYWLQRAVLDGEQTIWTPAHAPISWGWSIRAGRRYDGEWDIMRRKLMLPITGHDGLQLPVWRNNSQACGKRLNDGD